MYEKVIIWKTANISSDFDTIFDKMSAVYSSHTMAERWYAYQLEMRRG